MTAIIRTNHGEFQGKTVESIVRRIYGRNARIEWSKDPNTIERGQIVGLKSRTANAWPVLARLIWVLPEMTSEDKAEARRRALLREEAARIANDPVDQQAVREVQEDMEAISVAWESDEEREAREKAHRERVAEAARIVTENSRP